MAGSNFWQKQKMISFQRYKIVTRNRCMCQHMSLHVFVLAKPRKGNF
jgi:hypothetical protein